MIDLSRTESILRQQDQSRLDAAVATLENRQAEPARRIEALRSILRLQERVWARVPPSTSSDRADRAVDELAVRATGALRELGAGAEPVAWSLREYDAEQLGPIFGVSDDGDAAPQIVQAILDSPKAVVLRARRRLSPRTIGACLDAERMSAAGELPVGLEEYAKVRQAVAGRVPMTTNVGTVVLPRFYRPLPFVAVHGSTAAGSRDAAVADLQAVLAPFAKPPGGGGQLPITVYVYFQNRELRRNVKVAILRALSDAIATGDFADRRIHRLALLERPTDQNSRTPKAAIDIAAEAGLTDVMIEANARFESQDRLLQPGLLAFFEPGRVNEILDHAREKGVAVVAKNRIDTCTAARTIWAGLTTARGMGAHLAKFGLFPLTLEEQIEVISLVRAWFPTWTPAPAFYVDRPAVTIDRVYRDDRLVEPAIRWIDGAANAGADVVLIDSPDRTPAPAGMGTLSYQDDHGRRLLKRNGSDALGILTMDDLDAIEAAARRHSPPVRILWAGGLDGRQAFELARRKAFGIFTTSTTARRVAVPVGRGDPTLTSKMEPTYLGVLGVRMVIEAGFISTIAAERRNKPHEAVILEKVNPVLEALEQGALITGQQDRNPALDELRAVLEPAWEDHLASIPAVEP